MSRKAIWMLGTAPSGKGGIASILRQYQSEGLFDKGAMRLVETHHDRNTWGRVLPFLKAAAALWPALLLRRVSLLHLHASHGGSFWRKFILAAPALALGVPVITHLHSGAFQDFYAQGSALTGACIRQLFRRSFRVIALSEGRERWVREIEPQARTALIHNSMASPPAAAEPPPDPPTVLFLGRIGENKGSFDLLRAFARVHSEVPGVRLVFGGDGDIARLKSEVAALHLGDAVRYEGWVGPEQKEQLLRQAWLFALPSYHEGMPMAILEAMAHARAVVASPVGGIPEAVEHELTGFLVSPGHIDELTDCLLCILRDRDLATRLGTAGRAHFSAKFSNAANLPKLIALYKAAGVTDLPGR